MTMSTYRAAWVHRAWVHWFKAFSSDRYPRERQDKKVMIRIRHNVESASYFMK